MSAPPPYGGAPPPYSGVLPTPVERVERAVTETGDGDEEIGHPCTLKICYQFICAVVACIVFAIALQFLQYLKKNQ